MLGNDLDIGPCDVDLDECRRIIHTPKSGEVAGFDKRYYEENMKTNDFLTTFFNQYEPKMSNKIDKFLRPPYNNMIKHKLYANDSIR